MCCFQEEDRRRKPNLEVLRGHKLSANTSIDVRTASTVPQAGHSASPKMTTGSAVTHATMFPRSLLPPISHKRDISSANINRPLPVSLVCFLRFFGIMNKYILPVFHASWKVLEFFGKISRTWEVPENDFGPGRSWTFMLKVLESSRICCDVDAMMRTWTWKYSRLHTSNFRSYSDKTFFFTTCDSDEHCSMDATVTLLYVE